MSEHLLDLVVGDFVGICQKRSKVMSDRMKTEWFNPGFIA
jgi:hypothetical protein